MKTSHHSNKDMKKRIRMDIMTIPMIWIICITTHWPILFGTLISIWRLLDLGVTLWINKKINMGSFLDDDVRKATNKINLYNKFFYGTFAASLILAPIMLVYIFATWIERSSNPESVQWIVGCGVIFSLVFIANSIRYYRKHIEEYNELSSQFKEQ